MNFDTLLKQPYYAEKLKICKFLGIKKGWRVLDVGCGQGSTSIVCSYLVRDKGKVIGMDNDEVLLNEAKKTVKKLKLKNIELKLTDINKANFPKDYFDIVLLIYTPQYVRSKEKLVSIMKRIKKWSKLLGIAEQSTKPKSRQEKLYFMLNKFNKELENILTGSKMSPYSKKEMVSLVKKAGWKIEKQRELESKVMTPKRIWLDNVKRVKRWNMEIKRKYKLNRFDKKIKYIEKTIKSGLLPKFTDWYILLCKSNNKH